MCGFAVTDILWSSHLQVELLTEPLKAARRCLKPISRVTGPGAGHFSRAALLVSSPQVRGIQGLAPTRTLVAHVRHRDTGAQYPGLSLVTQSQYSLLIGWHLRRFDRPASHTSCTWWEKSSEVFTLTLASCLVTSKNNLNIIGSLFQGWHPYTWMIVRVTRWKVSANPPVRLVNPFGASKNRDFSSSIGLELTLTLVTMKSGFPKMRTSHARWTGLSYSQKHHRYWLHSFHSHVSFLNRI